MFTINIHKTSLREMVSSTVATPFSIFEGGMILINTILDYCMAGSFQVPTKSEVFWFNGSYMERILKDVSFINTFKHDFPHRGPTLPPGAMVLTRFIIYHVRKCPLLIADSDPETRTARGHSIHEC
jgi:hypothetical protein